MLVGIFGVVGARVSFCSRGARLLFPGPGSFVRRLGRGVRGFRVGCVLVPAGGAAGSIVVVWQLCFMILLGVGLLIPTRVDCGLLWVGGWLSEGMVVIQSYILMSGLGSRDKIPALCWLPGLHRKPYRVGFVADSGSCATAGLSGLLASCLVAVEGHDVWCCERVYERSGGGYFGLLKVRMGLWVDLKLDISMLPVCLFVGFSALFAALPHGLIKDRHVGFLALRVAAKAHCLLWRGLGCHSRSCRGCVIRWPFCWAAILFDLAPGCVDG